MNNKLVFSGLLMWTIPFSFVSAEGLKQESYVIAGYRFPSALYGMLQSGLNLPVLIENKQPNRENISLEEKYIQIGVATLYVVDKKLVLRNVIINNEDESKVQLSDELIAKIKKISEEHFDEKLHAPVSDEGYFTLDGKQMRLILNLSEKGYGTLIAPRLFDLDDPTSKKPSGTINYDFGGYNNRSSHSGTNNSGYLNFNSTTSLGVDHLKFDGSLYTGNSLSKDSSGRINAALWERDFKGLRTAAGMLDSWNMQSVGSVSALTGGEVYGFSIGNAANSRKRNGSLSLTPVVAFFPTAGEAQIRRDGNLLSIQRFSVGSHEIDTSMLPFGIYSIQVDVISGSRTISSGTYQINKPFTSSMGDSLRWQFWGGAYDRNKIYSNKHRYNIRTTHDIDKKGEHDREMMSLVGFSAGKSSGNYDWSMSSYMMREHALAELWASSRLTNWLSVNTQAMSATDGTWRTNFGSTLRLPYGIGSIWYNYNRLHSGEFISLYENRGSNWGVSVNVPSIGAASGGVITWTQDKDTIYGYNRRRLDYSQGIYAGRYGSIRLRTGIGYYDNNDGLNKSSNRETYAMLDFSIPFGNAISLGVSHSRDSGTAMNIDATHDFDGDYLKSVSANVSRSFSGDVDRKMTGGASVDFDTPFNANALSYQTDNDGGWSNTLTSQGSVAWSGMHIGAGKGRESSGVLIDTGLQRGEKLTLDIDGKKQLLQGNRNYISLPPYARYRMELMNNANTMESYEISEGARRTVSVYPGNVIYLQPKVKRVVTVFGRLINSDGSVAVNRQLKNKIGIARTGDDGRFVIDVDLNNPQLSIATKDDSLCSLQLNITQSDGAVWIGDVKCDRNNYVWQQSSRQGAKNHETTGS